MLKYYFTAILCVTAHFAIAQVEKSDKELLDSLIQNDPFFRALDSIDKPRSYVLSNLSIGNRLFSTRNNQVNTLEEKNRIIVTPSIGYYHKSGFGLSIAANLLTENDQTAFYQYSFSPSYDLPTNKKIAAGISYAHYLVKEKYELSVSPIKHDVYGYINLKRLWLNPGIAIGFANGDYTERLKVDTMIGVVRFNFTDTVTTTIKSFTVSANIRHAFNWFKLFNKNDGLRVQPQLILTAGDNSYSQVNRGATSYFNLVTRRRNRLPRFNQETTNSGFKLQSTSFQLTTDYMINKFSLRPDIYLDYYIPETTGKKLTAIFSLSLSYSIY